MSNWTANLHPRDFHGRFAKKGANGKRKAPSKKGRPTRGKRIARGANTFAQVTAAQAVTPFVPGAGGYVALNRRRNAQLARGEKGLRSTLTGRRIT